MHALARLLVAAVVLALSAGAAFTATGETKTDVALRAQPAAQSEVRLNIPSGASVSVGRCSHGWCGVTWNSYGGFARESGLVLHQEATSTGRPAIPVFPPYPYRAGHYPTVDDYYDLPPYADINPAFYSRRYFLTLRERYRYRYVPHVFHGSEDAYAK
jgi:hypothetical protein